MAEKNGFSASASANVCERNNENKIVSMKLFASWEIDKASPNCLPRLCMFNVTDLKITDALLDGEDVNSVILAVQMAGSRKVLRSGEIPLDTMKQDSCVDISFSMQYPHFLKRDVNNLRIALQRRKKYKNRPFLGYKTLAGGIIDLSQVLQRPRDIQLQLHRAGAKASSDVLAIVSLQNITSKPVNYDDGKRTSDAGLDRSPESEDEDIEGDEDEMFGDESCSEDDAPHPTHHREQRNFKQVIARLLSRFKTTAAAEKHLLTVLEQDDGDDSAQDALFDELGDLSEDSETDLDNLSIMSIPKPKLERFFDKTSSRDTILHSNAESESEKGTPNLTRKTDVGPTVQAPVVDLPTLSGGESEGEIMPGPEELTIRRDSVQLSKLFIDSEHLLPTAVYMVDERPENSYYPLAHGLYVAMQGTGASDPVVRIVDQQEVHQLITKSAEALQTFCNKNARSPPPMKLVMFGNDSFFNMILEPFIRVFSEGSSDMLNYVRFLPIPLVAGSLFCKQLSLFDMDYQHVFSDCQWQRITERSQSLNFMLDDNSEITSRISDYVNGATNLVQYPVSEAMISLSTLSKKEEGSQRFAPFLAEVTVGSSISVLAVLSPDTEEPVPPSPGGVKDSGDRIPSASPPGSAGSETCELQIDFWVSNKGDKSKSGLSKETLKGCFRSIHVQREKNGFHLTAVPREKKGKMIKIGKKSKEKAKDSKDKTKESDSIVTRDGISRIVCTTKDQNDTITVHLDQNDWQNVHFFQLSTQWQSHVKYFPVCMHKQTSPG